MARKLLAGPSTPVHITNDASDPIPTSGGASSGLTDAQLRAAAVPVSGPLTDTELRLTAVPTKNNAVIAAAADVHAPADNTAAVVTYSALAGVSHAISGVAWSYDADPTGGSLVITDNAAVVFSVFITKGGPGVFVFPVPKIGTVSQALTITLAAGGGTVQGTVSVLNHWMEA